MSQNALLHAKNPSSVWTEVGCDASGNFVLGAGTAVIGKVGPDTSATATLSNVSASATSVTVLAANTSRKRVVVYNDSTAILYLKFGATASATSFTYLLQGGDTYESPAGTVYTGVIDGIWASATGAARVTEMT